MVSNSVSVGRFSPFRVGEHTASQMQNPYLDNSHTIEVAMKDITIRISNKADPALLTRTFRLLQEFSC